MQNNASLVTMLEQPCVIARLRDEIRVALREFRESPRAYVTSALKGDSGGSRRKMLIRLGFAIGILMYAVVFASMLVFWSLARHETASRKNSIYIRTPLAYWPKAESANGEDRPGGGGGGGHNENAPPSRGNLSIFSLTTPIVAPTPEPQLNAPVLPVIETVFADPRLQSKRDDLLPTGLPDGANTPSSAGPGSDRGIGTGSGGGIGPGDGPGVGPGSGGNIGGEEFHRGVGPGATTRQQAVDTRPVLLNQPRPLYTEEARKSKIQGVVRARILVDASGAVKEVIVTRGLPGGLNEQAILAAYQMRFRPAMKDGRPVSYWLSNVEVEFNLR